MEVFSILFGVPFWAIVIFLWFRHLRRTRPLRSKRVVGTLCILALPMVAALSLGKYMFIDEPLFFAAGEGNVQYAKTLFAWGADANIDIDGTPPLKAAADAGHVEMVRLLLTHGADIFAVDDSSHQTALQAAQENRHMDVVRVLKEAGAQ